jgi:hypothetical protein
VVNESDKAIKRKEKVQRQIVVYGLYNRHSKPSIHKKNLVFFMFENHLSKDIDFNLTFSSQSIDVIFASTTKRRVEYLQGRIFFTLNGKIYEDSER